MAAQANKSGDIPARKRGRKPVITMEVIDKVCQYLMMGHYLKEAVSLCNVKERTWYAYVQRAEEAKRPTKVQRHLLQSIAKAEAQFINYHVAIINKAKDPRVSMEFLARRHPDRFGTTVKNQNINRHVDAEGKDTPRAVLVVPGQMDEKEWTEAAERYRDLQPTYEEPADDNSDTPSP